MVEAPASAPRPPLNVAVDDEFFDGLAEALDQHCTRLGHVEIVEHELAFMQWPKIHVHVHRGSPDRPWVTLRTEGMAEEPLTVPDGVGLDRIEMLLYLPGSTEDDVPGWAPGVLRYAAHLVHDSGSYYALFDSIQFMSAAEPIEDTPFAGALVRVPAAEPPGWDALPHRDATVRFLEMVLITPDELEFKLDQGGLALDERLTTIGVPSVNDPSRRTVPLD